jgi:oxygen-dependent protoporphyrinogen oxidase
VRLTTGETLEADAVIVATEAWAAAELAAGVDAGIASLLETIPCSSCATALMAFDVADCPSDLAWHGILSPMVEKRALTGVTLMSSKWPNRAPEGRVLVRGFLGGPRDQAVLEKSDAELLELARTQLVELIGLAPDARPRYARLFRWERGMPQYTLGHLDRVDEIERLEAGVAGFALAGNAYRGVGVPNALESGERAAEKVLRDLGLEPPADPVEERRVY